MNFISPTHGKFKELDKVLDIMIKKILLNEDSIWTIAIGTDSQNKGSRTKFCSAILLIEEGNGGIYFYSTSEEDRVHVVQNRMLREAELSINLGREVVDKIEERLLTEEMLEKELNIKFEIHCDLGHKGKSKDSISAAIGWISSEFGGLVIPRIKPDSTAASCIADKYTR